MENQETLFLHRVHSHHSDKTRSGAAVGSLGIVLAGVVLAASCIIGIRLIGAHWYLVLGALAGPVLIVIGVAYVIFSLVRPVRSVICPSCSNVHKVFGNTSNYVCPQCNELLILGNDHTRNPVFSTCSYCGLKTAASTDVSSFPCPDCGILRPARSEESETQKEYCTRCGSAVPRNAMYCVSCGHIFKTDLRAWTSSKKDPDSFTDLEWRAGKSARGHFVFARAVLKTIDNALDQGSFRSSDHSPFTLLEESMISMEVAAKDDTVRKDFTIVLPELDRTYGGVLHWELSVLDAVSSGSEGKELFSKIPIEQTYVRPRQTLERIFGDDLHSFGSIGEWSTGLLKWEEVKSVTGTGGSRYRLKNYDKLKEEAQRFSDWMGRHAEAAAVTPTWR